MIGRGLIERVDQLRAVGMAVSNDGTKTTFLGTSGDYNRIGDATTTSHSLNSEDDLLVTGSIECDGIYYADAGFFSGSYIVIEADDKQLSFGVSQEDVTLLYETADADAKIFTATIKESADSGNNVPVFAFMEATGATADLGLFDAFVEPLVCVVDNDKDSWCGMSFSADDVPILRTNQTGANGIVITNPKNAAASALSGTQLDVEIDIGGTPYHYTVYPTKA